MVRPEVFPEELLLPDRHLRIFDRYYKTVVLQIQSVGLLKGYSNFVVRREPVPNSMSVWYFNEAGLIAVDAINNPKAYVLGTKAIKRRNQIDLGRLADLNLPIRDAIPQ